MTPVACHEMVSQSEENQVFILEVSGAAPLIPSIVYEQGRYLLLRSSATAALKPAADAGNERAIQALAATAADPNQQALWLLAAQGLETAAAAGNATAIDGLTILAAAQNESIRKQAVLALEAAARKNQPRAEEALRKLGWR